MSTIDDEAALDSSSRTFQIIVAALIAGVAIFLGIAFAIAPIVPPARPAVGGGGAGGGPLPAMASMELGEILAWVAVALAAIGLPLSFVIPAQISRGMRRGIAMGKWTPPVAPNTPRGSISPDALRFDTGTLAVAYQTQFLIGAAINEGLAFFALAAYMIGRNPIALGLALLLIAALIFRFPTRMRLAAWIERQQELHLQDRQAGI
jgi:hypothetical protein